jgi:hypothetical protein
MKLLIFVLLLGMYSGLSVTFCPNFRDLSFISLKAINQSAVKSKLNGRDQSREPFPFSQRTPCYPCVVNHEISTSSEKSPQKIFSSTSSGPSIPPSLKLEHLFGAFAKIYFSVFSNLSSFFLY